MKKFLALTLSLVLVLSLASSVAEDLGVVVIGSPTTGAEPTSLDDMQLGATYTIDNYAKVTPQSFGIYDMFASFIKDAQYFNEGIGESRSDFVYYDIKDMQYNSYWAKGWSDARWQESGTSADFIWFQIDITNLSKKSKNFMEDAKVQVFYQDDYEFGGWIRQINYDYLQRGIAISRHGSDASHPNVVVLHPQNVESIGMLYTGTYIFGATLPASVIYDKKSPLRIVITIDGNELTYNIRK